ncbi:hypothetical protein ACWELJ_03100 [Nocardia sp. NPDC004582]
MGLLAVAKTGDRVEAAPDDEAGDAVGVVEGVGESHGGDRSRANYLLALHREFHERLQADIDAAIAPHPPGRTRLLAGSTAYLDGMEAAFAAVVLSSVRVR